MHNAASNVAPLEQVSHDHGSVGGWRELLVSNTAAVKSVDSTRVYLRSSNAAVSWLDVSLRTQALASFRGVPDIFELSIPAAVEEGLDEAEEASYAPGPGEMGQDNE